MYEREFGAGVPFGPATEQAREIILEADKKLLHEISDAGGVEAYFESHPELDEAFTSEKKDLCCMDERTASGTLRVPGSGMLIEGDTGQEEFGHRLKAAGVDGVYSHDECGAAKAYAKEHGIKDHNQAAIEYAKQLAEKLGVEYKGHLKTSGEHPGRVVYYDATNRLDTSLQVWQEKMPTGFTVTRGVLDQKMAREALVLGAKIAFSEHGYGPKFFSKEDPLTLIYVTDSEALSSEELQVELEKCYEEIVATIPEAKDKISIDGMVIGKQAADEMREAA